jgi:hypothetical protein
MTQKQLDVLVDLSETIYDAIKASTNGLPDGHVYAVLQGVVGLELYQTIIQALVSTGKITNKGHLLQVVTK